MTQLKNSNGTAGETYSSLINETEAGLVDGTSGKVPYVDAEVGDPVYALSDPRVLNPKLPPFNAKFDLRTLADGAITTGTNVLSCPSYVFSTTDIGKLVKVVGAGVAAAALKTTITGIGTGANAGKALLGSNASTTVSGSAATAPYVAGNVVFGTDDTDAIQSCLDASVAFSSSASNNPALSVRRVDMPQGVALITQLVIPRRGDLRGCSGNWGNYSNIYGQGFEQTNSSLLYQKWDQNKDAIIFTRSANGVDYVISNIQDFSVQQDLENSSGNGIHYRDASSNLLTWSDGNHARNVAVYGFAENGWKLPAGMVPGHLVDCRGMACGGYGLWIRHAANGSICDIDNFSSDQCDSGGVFIQGASGLLTFGAVVIRSLKYECTANIYRVGGARGEYALTLQQMGGAKVLVSGLDSSAGSGESAAPAGAIRLVAGSQQPMLEYEAVTIRVLVGQTGTPVLVNDLQSVQTVAGTVIHGVTTDENRLFQVDKRKMLIGSSNAAQTVAFFGATGTTKPAVTGSRGGNAALASLLTGLANLGLITDSSSA